MAVDPEAWARVIACIDGSGFWTLPEVVEAERLLTGGDTVVVEAVRAGRHHVVARSGMNEEHPYDPAAATLKRCVDLVDNLVLPVID